MDKKIHVLGREGGGRLRFRCQGCLPFGACVFEKPLLTQTTQLLHQLQDIMPKFDSNERIDERVEAAPKEGDALGDICGILLSVVITAHSGPSLCRNYRGPKQHYVVRHLTTQKDRHHC